MSSYTKLAQSILTSTIWMEEDHTRLVWVALMAMADRNGEVLASIPGLANLARVPVESCRTAINKFLSPDPDSRTTTDEGRRIEVIEGGWSLINHAQYREFASDQHRKEKAAERQQRFRERHARNSQVTQKPLPVTPGITSRSRSRYREQIQKHKEEGKGTAPATRPGGARVAGDGPSLGIEKKEKDRSVASTLCEQFHNFLISNRLHLGRKAPKLLNWRRACEILLDRKGGDVQLVKQVMEWYFLHWKDEWVGSYYAMSTFCDNFDKVEKAMRRTKDKDTGYGIKTTKNVDRSKGDVIVEAVDED